MPRRETSAEQGSRPSDAAPANVPGDGRGGAGRRGVSGRLVAGLVALTVALGAVAGVSYQRYAAAHLRPPPKLPPCVRAARMALRSPVAASGSERHETATGETVYLTPGEDRAVTCAFQIDEAFSRHLAGALAEHDAARRAGGLLELVRDRFSADPQQDRAVFSAYMIAAAAVRALPSDVPEVSAAAEQLDVLVACRFGTRRPCPTRPPMPAIVWVAGVPAGLGLASLGWIGGAAGVTRLRAWWSRRQARKSAGR